MRAQSSLSSSPRHSVTTDVYHIRDIMIESILCYHITITVGAKFSEARLNFLQIGTGKAAPFRSRRKQVAQLKFGSPATSYGL